MKLREFMEMAEDGIVYHIGSKSGFLFIVTPEEYKTQIKQLDAHSIEYLLKKIVDSFETSIIEPKVKRMYEDEDIIQGYIFTSDYEARQREKAKGINKFNRSIKKLKEFVPYEDREVIEAYDRNEENTAVVRIKGNEEGKFWIRSEYEKWAKKYLNEEEDAGDSDEQREATIDDALDELRM